MYSGNANVEGECLTVEAMMSSGLRVSMMGATCNLPSRPNGIITYCEKRRNRSKGLKSVSNSAHPALHGGTFQGANASYISGSLRIPCEDLGFWAFAANLLNFR